MSILKSSPTQQRIDYGNRRWAILFTVLIGSLVGTFGNSMSNVALPSIMEHYGIGLNVGYFRTWYGGFLATDNQVLTPGSYDSYCVTAPTDSRLPNSGQRLCGLYDVKP